MYSLKPEEWREISPYLDQALSLSETERQTWLQAVRVQRPDLSDSLQQLLEQHELLSQQKFLDQPPERPNLESSLAGRAIGPYTLLSLIGQGGMGDVWLAERNDGRFERRVALKFLRFSVASAGGKERFKREGRILGQLSHANIAELIDAGVTPNEEPYLVLEYVEGEHIDEYCDRHRLGVDARIRLFLEVLSAVASAHSNLIVHRDLKPSNVLVRKDGRVKLLDFGIAKLLSGDGSLAADGLLTQEGAGALTLQFAAPEQVTGGAITTATDVYSLGVLLYLLLAGTHPAGPGPHSSAELIKAIVETEPARASDRLKGENATAEKRNSTPEKLNRELTGDLDTILRKALKKNPAERYTSATALADDLRRYLEHEPISARPDTFTYRFSKFAHRNKLGVTLTALAALATVIVMFAVNREARRAEYRFQQVRKLARTVLFDLNPEIENLSGSTTARELLVKTSLDYLDSLAKESGNDPSLQLELATAYAKIGNVQGNAKYSNLGHPEAALQSYGKAIAIARKVGQSPEALELLANTYSEVGSVRVMQLGLRTEGRENLRLATTIADSLPNLTGKPYYQLRVLAYGYLGDIDGIFDPVRAAEPLRHALDLSTEWSHVEAGPEPRIFAALFTREKGDILWGTGDLPQARETFLQALAMFKDAMAQDPTNADWDRERLLIMERLGLVSGDPDYFNLGDRSAAVEWLQKSVSEDEQRVAADSRDQRARSDLSQSLAELAGAYRDADPLRAEKLYERSLSPGNSALQTDPEDADVLTWQSFARIWFSANLQRLGKKERALSELTSAVTVAQRLVDRDHTSIPAREVLGVALYTRARQLLILGDAAGAEKDLQQSEQVLSGLHKEFPNTLLFLRDLADCYQAKGDLAAHRSDWQAANLQYEKSANLWEHWTDIGKSTVYDQQRRQQASAAVRNASKHLHGHSSSLR